MSNVTDVDKKFDGLKQIINDVVRAHFLEQLQEIETSISFVKFEEYLSETDSVYQYLEECIKEYNTVLSEIAEANKEVSRTVYQLASQTPEIAEILKFEQTSNDDFYSKDLIHPIECNYENVFSFIQKEYVLRRRKIEFPVGSYLVKFRYINEYIDEEVSEIFRKGTLKIYEYLLADELATEKQDTVISNSEKVISDISGYIINHLESYLSRRIEDMELFTHYEDENSEFIGKLLPESETE